MTDGKRIKELSPGSLETISHYRYDLLIESHELWSWKSVLEPGYVDFFNAEGFSVLLPVEKENHHNLAVRRLMVSNDRESLTIFLEDTTHYRGSDAGFVAVCDKVPGEDCYIAVVYHSCRLVNSREMFGEKG